jgi:hypothetical protein
MKNKIIIVLILLVVTVLFIGNTHRILPSSKDPCQTDMTHMGHVNELPIFHCIGHTEFVVDPNEEGLLRVAHWDHIHSWMTLEWHLEQGFTKEHALKLISQSKKG